MSKLPRIHTYLRVCAKHKFGIDLAEAELSYERASKYPNLSLEGVSCHIGSQIVDIEPMLEVFDKMVALVERLRARGCPSARWISAAAWECATSRTTRRCASPRIHPSDLRESVRRTASRFWSSRAAPLSPKRACC